MNYYFLKNKRFLWPTGLFLLFLICYLILFQIGDVKYYNLARTLTQWDAVHYLSIADSGYEKFPCDYNPSYICGNVGWFPFYPLVARIVTMAGIDANLAVLLVSWLSFWAALIIIFYLLESMFNRRTALLSLVALLLFPTSFYFLTAFPYSLYLLLTSIVFLLLHKKRYTWLFLPSGFLAVTYPSGIIIALPLLYCLVRNWREHSRSDRLGLVAGILSTGLALLLYYSYNWIRFDDFFLYNHFQAQSYYAHGISFPLLTVYKSLLVLNSSNPVFTALVYMLAVVVLFYTRRVPVGWQIFLFAALLFTPSFGTTTCYYRHIVIAFPLFVMVGAATESNWRLGLYGLYVIVSVYLTGSVFLHAYKLGRLM